MSTVPYVVGQWVRGERFYGRAAQIAEILGGPRDAVWLLGTRRVGKTSFLKQLEYLTSRPGEDRYFPLFWDFQGADESEELHLDFADAVLDAEDRLGELGIAVAEVEDDDLFVALGRLRRRLRKCGRALLLLCDEVEELITLGAKDPALLRKLRRAMQSREDIRSVLASSIRLWALADQRDDTSPFLHGFTPPIYIHRLTDGEARGLARQDHLPAELRPTFDEVAVEAIRLECDNHPYLIQLVAKRALELGDLDEAFEQVATDSMVSYFFRIDFEMLSESERRVVRVVAGQSAATSRSIRRELPADSDSLNGWLHRLENLGFLRRDGDRRFVLANAFFRRWLAEVPMGSPEPGRSPASDAVTLTREIGPELLDGRYELQAELGSGATGVVFQAYDRLLRVQVAVKILRPEIALSEEALERFRQEIVLSRDLGHPNILRVYHLGEAEGRKYLTMQWVDGPTLAGLIRDEAPLAEERVLALGRKLALGLEAAHRKKVLHRDIKPQNILVADGSEPYLTDFGLARVIGEPGITRAGLFLGTPYYTSPEQAEMGPLDERSDLYSLGLVFFEMATGRRPFEGESTQEILDKHRHEPPPDPRQLEPRVSPGLARVILRCIEKDRSRRFASAGALLEAFDELAAQAGLQASQT